MSGLHPITRSLVDSARIREANEDDLAAARVRASLAARMGAGVFATTVASAGAAAGGASKAATSAWGIKKVVVLLALAGAAIGGTTYAVHASRAYRSASMVASSPAIAAAQQPPPSPPIATAADPPNDTADSPLVPSSAPSPTAAGATRASPARSSTAKSASSGAGGTFEEELELMNLAQGALRAGDNARALDLAREHARRFPKSQLSEERDVVRVLASCGLGKTDGATHFLRAHPSSPMAGHIRASCKLP
jgi:hypothetical protein